MRKMQWSEEEIEKFCKKLDARTYLQCNYCGHLTTFPSEQLVEKENCINCDKKYKETKSEIRRVK